MANTKFKEDCGGLKPLPIIKKKTTTTKTATKKTVKRGKK